MKKRSIDLNTQLMTVPVRNAHVTVERAKKNPDVLFVAVDLRYRGFLKPIANLVRARRRKRFQLVGISRQIFEKIDGERNVASLVEYMRDEHLLPFLEARALISQYLGVLMKKGLIVIVEKGT